MTILSGARSRLVQVDSLRGIAALAVVLFHFTTRFVDLFKPTSAPAVTFPLGHYGVNLFFMISGFVIFMTLQRTRRGMDFVVSRFSRLFPAYWTAIALTFGVTHLLGLPGREVGLTSALLNGLMFHGLLGVPDVDAAYWTLLVELLFYFWMFVLFKARRLEQVHLWVIGLLGCRWIYFVAEAAFGISLPWRLYMLLILQFIPWFALGIACHSELDAQATGRRRFGARVSALLALATLFLAESVFVGALACAFTLVLYGAAAGRVRLLAWRPLLWLGAITYPLYLVHEYIGWSILLRLTQHGIDLNLSIVLVLALSLLLAHLVTRTVEQPAMAWIRQSWRRRHAAQDRPTSK